jgi:hypothetical protein
MQLAIKSTTDRCPLHLLTMRRLMKGHPLELPTSSAWQRAVRSLMTRYASSEREREETPSYAVLGLLC